MSEPVHNSQTNPEGPLRRALRAVDRNGERWLLLVFYMTIVVVVTSEVVRRFLFNYSSVWGGEVARYLFIYLAWIGASAAIRERAHIRIDALVKLLPSRGQALIYIFGDLMTLMLALIAVYWSIGPILVSLRFHSVTEALGVSRAWFLAAVPLGFGMMIARLAQSFVRDIKDLVAGRPPFEGGKLFE